MFGIINLNANLFEIHGMYLIFYIIYKCKNMNKMLECENLCYIIVGMIWEGWGQMEGYTFCMDLVGNIYTKILHFVYFSKYTFKIRDILTYKPKIHKRYTHNEVVKYKLDFLSNIRSIKIQNPFFRWDSFFFFVALWVLRRKFILKNSTLFSCHLFLNHSTV